jgi:adenylate cyclase
VNAGASGDPAPGRRELAGRIERLGRTTRIRLLGLAVLLVLVVLTALQTPWVERLQSAWFDALQMLAPRQVGTLSVTVVEIDQKSLLAVGQWPWPRHVLAQLVEQINAAGPAAIALNMLMPEPDALSPERLYAQATQLDPALVATLRTLPSNDAILARALARAPVVLTFAGTREATEMSLRAPPILVRDPHPHIGTRAKLAVTGYVGALVSIEQLDSQAAGHGLISADPKRGVIRRMPLVASIDDTLVPSLAIEMLRVALHQPTLRLDVSGSAARRLSVGALSFPTEGDGAVRVYFSPHRADRFVSAVEVLEGRVDAAQLQRQLVLIGLTGIGLFDEQNTPIGERMSGSEIHAQLLENLIDGTLLQRPAWAPYAEALVLLALGALLLWTTPRWRAANSALLLIGCIGLSALAAFTLIRHQQLLIDVALPAACLVLLFGVLLVLTLGETTRQRKSLEGVVQRQREDSARIAGEMQAAQRIQTDTLPRADLLRGDARIELHATLQPAREVGGDMYDYFMLDARRLFLLVGDVAGHGLSASIFMAVSKALTKSAMLRTPGADIGAVMRVANAEVSRDNPEELFVTVFAAILDLDTGELDYCNAGHDNPYRWLPPPHPLQRIEDGDGPPLCAVADFDYRGARCRLAPGEILCLMTDGVTEALDTAGQLYGHQRLEALLQAHRDAADAPGTARLVEALHADVRAFAAGAEPADDLTILALRWNGVK